jgi:hypothetical protein
LIFILVWIDSAPPTIFVELNSTPTTAFVGINLTPAAAFVKIDFPTDARAQRPRTEFESIRFKEGETVDDLAIRLGSLIVELGTLGEVIKEQQVVQKLLQVVPKHLSQVAITIEVTQDLSKLTLEDAGGRLRAAEDRTMEDDAPPPLHVDSKLLLTEEQ